MLMQWEWESKAFRSAVQLQVEHTLMLLLEGTKLPSYTKFLGCVPGNSP